MTKDAGYTTTSYTLTAGKEYINGNNNDKLQKQLGIGAISVQRSVQAPKQLLITDVAVGTTAITDIERIVYGIYTYDNYFDAVYPKAKQDAFIKATRAAMAAAKKQPANAAKYGSITYNSTSGGYSLYQLEVAKAKLAADASPKGVLAITKTGISADANDKGLVTFFTDKADTVKKIYAETTLCKTADTSAKLAKCLDEAYYVADALRRHIGYSTGTTFNKDVLQYQVFYSKLDFNPQQDIKTETAVAIDPAAPDLLKLLYIGGWYSESYLRHDVQFYSVLDMILVQDWASIVDSGSDIFKKLFITDNVDSVRLQEIITKAREYPDFAANTVVTAATVDAQTNIKAKSLSSTATPMLKLKIAYAYELSINTTAVDAVKLYTKATFDS